MKAPGISRGVHQRFIDRPPIFEQVVERHLCTTHRHTPVQLRPRPGAKLHRGMTMSSAEMTLDDLFEDGRAIDEALMDAARDARRFHKALGNPMATWLDGRVVWVQPEDIRIDVESSLERRPSE